VSRELSGQVFLVIDPDSGELRHVKSLLEKMGAKVHLAHGLEDALGILSVERVQIVLYAYDLPFSGAELKENYQAIHRPVKFFALSSTPVSRLEPGVDGWLLKPLEAPALLSSLGVGALQNESLTVSTLDPLTQLLRPHLIFRSQAMKNRLSQLPQMAVSNHGILISGETGTGKEVVAQTIHHLSQFKGGPFIGINCGAIPESLIEGELFGHEKGAFTGANATHKGKFELAEGGTLFLDEIGEMPLLLQARLLRVLEERELYRVGGEKAITINVRILAATRVDLRQAVQDGLFREDLYYRLNILPIQLPALRERVEDIPLLAWHFLERAFSESIRPKPFPSLTDHSINLLQQQPWEGNVRELRNLMTRLAVLLPANITYIEPKHLAGHMESFTLGTTSVLEPKSEDSTGTKVIEVDSLETNLTNLGKPGIFIPYPVTMKEAQNRIINMALEKNQGNKTNTAKVLGVSIRTLRRRTNEDS